jgi:hypothetical protein
MKYLVGLREIVLLLSIIKFSVGFTPYDIDLHAADPLIPNDKEYANLDKVKVKRLGRNQPHVVIGEVELFKPFGKDVLFRTDLYKKQGQEYRKTPFHLKRNACEYFEKEDPFADQLWSYTDLPSNRSCPYPPKVYHINGLYIGNLSFPVVLETGDYMIQTQFLDKDNNLLQGLQVYFFFVNKVLG